MVGVSPRPRVTRRSRGVAREGDVGYKASTRGVMAKCVFYMIGGRYVKASTRGVMRPPKRTQTHLRNQGLVNPKKQMRFVMSHVPFIIAPARRCWLLTTPNWKFNFW